MSEFTVGELVDMLHRIIRRQKEYEMHGNWNQRRAVQQAIHDAAAIVYPEMKWCKEG